MRSSDGQYMSRRRGPVPAWGLSFLLAVLIWGALSPAAGAGIGAKAVLESRSVLDGVPEHLVAGGQPVDSFWRGGILYLVLDSRDPDYLQEVAELVAWLASLGIECRLIDRADLAACFAPVYWDTSCWGASWWWYYPWWTDGGYGWWPYPPGKPEPPPEKPRLRPYEPPETQMPWQWIAARPQPAEIGLGEAARLASLSPSPSGETRGSPSIGGSSSGGFSGGGSSSPSPSSGGGSPSSDRGGKR